MKNESCASSSSFQRGSACLRIARASSMPTDLPPISPVPIIRFQMASTSASVRYFSASRSTRSSREMAIRSKLAERCCSASSGGPLARAGSPPRPPRPAGTCGSRRPGGSRTDSSPAQGMRGEDLGDRRALGDRQELVAFPGVQHVHRGRVAVLHLDRMDVQAVPGGGRRREDLRRLGDRRGGVERMAVAQQREDRRATPGRRGTGR